MLGAPAAVSRSLNYVNLSSVCSWATGTRNPVSYTHLTLPTTERV